MKKKTTTVKTEQTQLFELPPSQGEINQKLIEAHNRTIQQPSTSPFAIDMTIGLNIQDLRGEAMLKIRTLLNQQLKKTGQDTTERQKFINLLTQEIRIKQSMMDTGISVRNALINFNLIK